MLSSRCSLTCCCADGMLLSFMLCIDKYVFTYRSIPSFFSLNLFALPHLFPNENFLSKTNPQHTVVNNVLSKCYAPHHIDTCKANQIYFSLFFLFRRLLYYVYRNVFECVYFVYLRMSHKTHILSQTM